MWVIDLSIEQITYHPTFCSFDNSFWNYVGTKYRKRSILRFRKKHFFRYHFIIRRVWLHLTEKVLSSLGTHVPKAAHAILLGTRICWELLCLIQGHIYLIYETDSPLKMPNKMGIRSYLKLFGNCSVMFIGWYKLF